MIRRGVPVLAAILSAALAIAGPARADPDRERACLLLERPRHVAPVIALEGPAHAGTDRAAEPFALAMMTAAAAWRGLGDAAAAEDAVNELRRWQQADALRVIGEAGPDRSNTNSIYSLRRIVIALLGAWRDLESSPAGRAAAGEIEPWLARLVARQDVATGGARSRAAATGVSNRNNHVLLRATVEAQWAALAGRVDLAARAYATAHTTLEGMRSDGSLPLETARGVRALWYQRHAVASLVYLAELLAPFGFDLWQPRADGADLHRAIAFLVDATGQPARLAPYTGEEVAHRQDLGFLEPRGNGRNYMAWAELYRARFPDRPEAAALTRILPHAGQPGWPLIDDYVGGNATCRILTPVRAPQDRIVRHEH